MATSRHLHLRRRLTALPCLHCSSALARSTSALGGASWPLDSGKDKKEQGERKIDPIFAMLSFSHPHLERGKKPKKTKNLSPSQPLRRPQAPLRGFSVSVFHHRDNSGDDRRPMGTPAEQRRASSPVLSSSPSSSLAAPTRSQKRLLFSFGSLFHLPAAVRRRLLLVPSPPRRRRGPLVRPAPFRGQPGQLPAGGVIRRRRQRQGGGGGPGARPGRRGGRGAAAGEQARPGAARGSAPE